VSAICSLVPPGEAQQTSLSGWVVQEQQTSHTMLEVGVAAADQSRHARGGCCCWHRVAVLCWTLLHAVCLSWSGLRGGGVRVVYRAVPVPLELTMHIGPVSATDQ